MISLVLIVLCLVLASDKRYTRLNHSEAEWICATAATSLSVGVMLQGLLGLAMASAELGRFPIIAIIGIGSIIFFSIGRNRSRLIYFGTSMAGRIGGIRIDREKEIYILIALLGATALIISIGPINHPDAADYHAGYPYLYWHTGKLVVDGGLHQGLIGLGDFAYIPFFQERSTWII